MNGSGRLIAIGGFTERARERDLLRLFYEAAGGPDARLVVLAAEPAEIRALPILATPAKVAERLAAVFEDLGAESVETLGLGAGAPRARPDLLEGATGLFLAGNGPSWLPLPDGPWSEVVRRQSEAGMVVGGSGAGAALLTEQCIAPSLGRRRFPDFLPGLGLLPGLLLDPLPRQRNRLSRLLDALAVDPTLLALGIDEDTAVIVDPGEETFEVRGVGAVLVIDAKEAVRPSPAMASMASMASTGGDPLPMLGLRVDLLTAGCRYDLRERQARPGTVHASRMLAPGKPPGE